MSGNQSNSSPLTAFTLISLLETMETQDSTDSLATSSSDGDTNQTLITRNELLDKTLPCLSLVDNDGGETDPYTTALIAYALVLANRTDEARKKIDWMMNHAQRNNSFIWWQKTGSSYHFFISFFKYEKLIPFFKLKLRKWTCFERRDDVVRSFEFS